MTTKRHRCIRFCCSCFSLTNEKEHDHTSAGAQSAPSDEKGHDPTPAGAQSAPSDEKGHDPTSAGARSSPSAIDSTIENLPGAPKRTEAPISGSNLNVSGAEAQVSESSNVPLISEGENVNANQNVSGPPGCNEAPSSSSSSGAIKSGLLSSIRHTDIAKVDGKYVVDVDKLIEHISDLFKLREEEKHLHQNASIPRNFPWPDVPGLTKLKKILPFGTDLRNLNELLSAGLKCVSDLKDIISGPVKTFLKDIGQVSIVTAGLLVVAYTLERFDDLSTNKEKCWDLLKEMCYVATVVKRLKANPKGTQDVIEEEATALLVEGAIMCCTQIDSSAWKRVEDIVGKDELRMLESRALVTRTTNVVASVHNARQKSSTNVVASVHDVILTLARQKSEEESKGKELRLTFTSASKLKEFLKEKGAKGIKGIWLSDNKDALEISATTLDLMSKSLRVLQLGILTKVEGECRKIFNKLVFFEAKITQLPFRDVSKLEQLRYLSYEPNDLKLSKMPSSLRHMEFDGRSHSHVFQFSSTDLERLRNLRILRLVNFLKLRNLPEGLGDQLSGLQELSLSDCHSIKKLPEDFHCLTSLQRLNLSGCWELEGRSMDHMVKMNRLQVVHIEGSEQLVNRWAEIQRDGDGLWSFTVI